MATIVEAVLNKTISELENISATLQIAVLQFFSGLLSLHINKRKGDSLLLPMNWLRSIIVSPDYATKIIHLASTEAAKQRRPDNVPSVWAQPRVEALRARTLKIMGDGRIRAATNNVNTIAEVLEGQIYAEPLTEAALQQRIDILHPNSDDMNPLPPAEDDPPAEPLQITPDQLRQHLYGLSFDFAAGNTGWTHSMLYDLCNDGTTPALQASLSPLLPSTLWVTTCF